MSLTGPEDYWELTLAVEGDAAEIWTARLADAGFEMFLEEDPGLKAYVPASQYQAEPIQALVHEAQGATPLFGGWQHIPAQNWNQTWENHFEPVRIADQLYVRAQHHAPDPAARLELVIEPKMSFGTGHHATTSQVAAFQLGLPHQGATVVDAGSGTGILAILAEKLGAARVIAFDHESWATENARENAANNGCTRVEVSQADLETFEPGVLADGVLANITRNLVITYLPRFAQWLKPGGWLLTSGYYEDDLDAVRQAAEAEGLAYMGHTVQEKWCAAHFGKPTQNSAVGP